MDTKNLIAVVTGGASGLGEAAARQLVMAGADVTILDVDEIRGEAIKNELGNSCLFCKTDIVDEIDVQNALNKTIQTFGAIHVAINCAGIAPPAKVLSKEGPLPIAQFKRVIDINVIGTMNLIRLAADKMMFNPPNKDGEKGVIVNTASIAAFEGQVGQAAYSASKAAVVGMTLPIAREFADYGIRVMTIAPGMFLTPMMASLPDKVQIDLVRTIPFPKRMGRPSEFAMLVLQIIENPILNGETIRLDGAIRMSA